MTNNSLNGMAALVTGGSGGIGAACAEALLRDGAAVVIMGRHKDTLVQTRDKLLAAVPSGRVEIYAGSALETKDVQAALAHTHGMLNRLDIIVATVGGGGFKPLLMHDADSFRAELDQNIISAFLAMRYGAPLMGQGGSIVCISSTAGVTAFPWLSAYCTGKGGLESLIRTAADELAAAKIRVNAIRPGLTRSNATTSMFESPDVMSRFLEQIPLQRGGDPADIAAGVRYLAGPESAWVTGQSFAVDGGHELRRNPDLSPVISAIYGEQALATLRAGKSPTDTPEAG